MAFGVTPATVRSWECGRTSPRGGRREAYRRFLAGLAQHSAIEVPGGVDRRPAAPVRPKAVPRETVPRETVPPKTASPAVRVAPRAEPVPPGRIRRLRVLGAAACAWSIAALWVILTCPPPL